MVLFEASGSLNLPFSLADRMFVATLYSSDSDKIMRYTDEVSARFDVIGGNGDGLNVSLFVEQGETQELCKWTVDLGVLPTFQQNANMPNRNGFYTGGFCRGSVINTVLLLKLP